MITYSRVPAKTEILSMVSLGKDIHPLVENSPGKSDKMFRWVTVKDP